MEMERFFILKPVSLGFMYRTNKANLSATFANTNRCFSVRETIGFFLPMHTRIDKLKRPA